MERRVKRKGDQTGDLRKISYGFGEDWKARM